MALQDDLKTALIEAGERLKEDLWTEQDPVVLEQRAKDLAGLAQKALTSNDEAKRKQYALAAELVIQHVALLALLRLNYAEKHVLEEIEKFFKDALAAIIPMLFAAI
jgi:hypothetical protein